MPSIERVNLVDAQGNRLERGVEREPDGQYGEGVYMEIVIAVVFNGLGQVIVQRRGYRPGKRMSGYLDHVCGGMLTDIDNIPADGAVREIGQEIGLTMEPNDLRLVSSRPNPNNYYRHLLIGVSDEPPHIVDPDEVDQISCEYPNTLRNWDSEGIDKFVPGYFPDLAIAEAAYTQP